MYCRILVDDELDRDNVSIENQKAIIADFVKQKFPGSTLTVYEDRDRSGYTFEQREGYQAMRRGLMSHKEVPPYVTVHRITGDGAKRNLVAPLWSGDKKRVLNYLQSRLLQDSGDCDKMRSQSSEEEAK